MNSSNAQPAGSDAVVTVSTFQPKLGRRDDLVELLADIAPQIRAEAGCLHYSVHHARGSDTGPLLVIQMSASIEVFAEHSARAADQIPRISALLETPPTPPTLFEPLPLGGDKAKECLTANLAVDSPTAGYKK